MRAEKTGDGDNAVAEENLRNEAGARGIDPDRLLDAGSTRGDAPWPRSST